MNANDHTPAEWFALAERCYLEKHQGCVWCGGSHRVFCMRKDRSLSYYCQGCDCRSSHDGAGGYQFVPGEILRDRGPDTMDSGELSRSG